MDLLSYSLGRACGDSTAALTRLKAENTSLKNTNTSLKNTLNTTKTQLNEANIKVYNQQVEIYTLSDNNFFAEDYASTDTGKTIDASTGNITDGDFDFSIPVEVNVATQNINYLISSTKALNYSFEMAYYDASNNFITATTHSGRITPVSGSNFISATGVFSNPPSNAAYFRIGRVPVEGSNWACYLSTKEG